MTPTTQMYCLYLDTKLTKETRKSILDSGFSRVPICYSEQYKFVVGILLTKKLISIEPSNQTVAKLFVQKLLQIKVPLYVHKTANLRAISTAFKEGRSHMAIVCKDVEGPDFETWQTVFSLKCSRCTEVSTRPQTSMSDSC